MAQAHQRKEASVAHHRKNLFDEWNEQLDVITPITRAMRRFLRIIASFFSI
jgi:hypothetical protein